MKQLQIDLTPDEYASPSSVRRAVAKAMGVREDELEPFRITRRSIDCRRRPLYHCIVEVGESTNVLSLPFTPSHSLSLPKKVIIVGAGPAGLFAALRALQLGMKPIIVERGKPVEERKKDIVSLVRTKEVNPDSNWCFGEGGAGTYSDGKLYTRSTKRGDVSQVLRLFVEHGADPDIMVDVHAHIGTDRLPAIIASMRKTIIEHGGEYHFNTRVTDFIVKDGKVIGVEVEVEDVTNVPSLPFTPSHSLSLPTIEITADAVILATGHSARDIYELFTRRGWLLEAKPFALGVRVEHPQELINEIQYHGKNYSKLLPPATYSLTTQVYSNNQTTRQSSNQHGVFSFCMCPGGVIVPAATAGGQQVVNGMSNAARNSGFANSGIAVTVNLEDIGVREKCASQGIVLNSLNTSLALLNFQKSVERRAFEAAGNTIDAPSQRLVDFLRRKPSSRLNKSNYMGHCVSAPLHEILPDFVVDCLIQGFKDFDRKMRGFITEEASLLAVESRTSSPVRIPRDKETLQHPQLQGLYPCGEGAGYAGGIVSSALDGIRCVEAIGMLHSRQ
jgi:hypothetical protein